MDLLTILQNYEGAVSKVERDGDDSDEALKELEDARSALLNVLQTAKEWEKSLEATNGPTS